MHAGRQLCDTVVVRITRAETPEVGAAMTSGRLPLRYPWLLAVFVSDRILHYQLLIQYSAHSIEIELRYRTFPCSRVSNYVLRSRYT